MQARGRRRGARPTQCGDAPDLVMGMIAVVAVKVADDEHRERDHRCECSESQRGKEHDHSKDRQRRDEDQRKQSDHRELRHPDRLRDHEAGRRKLLLRALDRCARVLGHRVLTVPAASRMSFVTSAGCERYDAWDELIATVWALARLAMNRCAAGLMTSSWRPIRYHEGIVF